MKKGFAFFMLLLLLCGAMLPAWADVGDGEGYYTLRDTSGVSLCRIACDIQQDDEYVASDNRVYRVLEVDESNRVATCEYTGDEPMPALPAAWQGKTLEQILAVPVSGQNAGKTEASPAASGSQAYSDRTVAMYCTHSDESYEPSDGTSSDERRGGIYDVAEWLTQALQERGVDVILDESTHFPHDSGAYERSRATASRLLQHLPVAIFDIHRDGVPADEYQTEIEGQSATQVRLLVGRSNPNSETNRAFADLVKAVADEQTPGLIKDIYVGKGNYNQELAPNSLLLEFGTHESDKESVKVAVDHMAGVLTLAVFGSENLSTQEQTEGEGEQTAQGASAAPKATSENIGQAEKNVEKSRGVSIGWWIVLGVVLLVVFTLAITGSFKTMWHKIKRTSSEVTGGAVGEKPDSKEDPNSSGDHSP